VYTKAPTGSIVVRAKAGSQNIEIPVDIRQAAGGTRGTLGRLWARTKVASLEDLLWEPASKDEAQKEITRLGLDFHLVTAFTSLIAVDKTTKVGDGNPEQIVQPVENPEGMDMNPAPMELDAMQYAPQGGYMAEEVMVVSGTNSCLCRMGAGASERSGAAAGLGVVVILLWRRRRARDRNQT